MYKVEFEKTAKKSLDKLDNTMRKRVIKLLDRVSNQDDPKISGHPLSYDKAGQWTYKIDYLRVICDINEESKVIKVLDIAKREKRAYSENNQNEFRFSENKI